MVIPGFQPNKSHALELSTCNELNNLFAMSSLPISLAAKPKSLDEQELKNSLK